MSKTDWSKIKSEYINSNISQRNLADKYKISPSTLMRRANKEKWKSEKEKNRSKITAKVQQKIEEEQIKTQTDRLLRVNIAADRLLEKVEEAIEQLNNHVAKKKTKTKKIQYNDSDPKKPDKEIIEETEKTVFVKGDIDRIGLKAVATALKEIKDVYGGADDDGLDKLDEVLNRIESDM